MEKLRYMHRNPVTRGLARRPEEWAWSSFRHWATGERGTVEIESPWTAQCRGGLPSGLMYPDRDLFPTSQKRAVGHPVLWRESKMWATRRTHRG